MDSAEIACRKIVYFHAIYLPTPLLRFVNVFCSLQNRACAENGVEIERQQSRSYHELKYRNIWYNYNYLSLVFFHFSSSFSRNRMKHESLEIEMIFIGFPNFALSYTSYKETSTSWTISKLIFVNSIYRIKLHGILWKWTHWRRSAYL